jgi:hypothetical protein
MIFSMRLGEKLSISTQRALREWRGSTRVREDTAVSAEVKKAESRSFGRRLKGSHAICESFMSFNLHLLRCIRRVSLSKQGLAESSPIQSFNCTNYSVAYHVITIPQNVLRIRRLRG